MRGVPLRIGGNGRLERRGACRDALGVDRGDTRPVALAHVLYPETGIAGAVLAATTYAHAAPSANKLQTDCNTSVTKSCIMHKTVGYEKYEGEARQAGSTAVNCGDLGEYEYTVGGEVTLGSETSTSVSVGVSAGFFDVVEVSVEASFGESSPGHGRQPRS